MPPKKVQIPEIKPLIGRIGTNLQIGIGNILYITYVCIY